MKKQILTNQKENMGITLIALVITIIVLLILAGISIAMLTGENGVLTKATTAKEEQSHGQVKEAISLAYTEYQMALLTESKEENKKVATTGIFKLANTKTTNSESPSFWDFLLEKKYINQEGIIQMKNLLETTTGFGNGSGNVDVYIIKRENDNYTLTYYSKNSSAILLWSQNQTQSEGNDDQNPPEPEVILNASDISASEEKNLIYGSIVTDYTCTNSEAVNAWKIFYADSTNIYLIADGFINPSYFPSCKGNVSVDKRESDWRINFSSLNSSTSSYKGSSDITDQTMKALNSDYFSKNYSSTNLNMKVTAYLLDKSAWSSFAGSGADYAIGGPSIELLLKSYNEKHSCNYQARAKNNTGYEISKGDGTWANAISGMLDSNDTLYAGESNRDKATGMWLASPSPASDDYGICVSGGFVGSNSLTLFAHNLRPVVRLNTSVSLKKTGSNTYQLLLPTGE